MDVAQSYHKLYNRLMDIRAPTRESLKHTFSDKELRVVMGMNKIWINDFCPDGAWTTNTEVLPPPTSPMPARLSF